MKKIFLLLLSMSFLFVIGCGSGGGSTASSSPADSTISGGAPGEPIAAGMGRIVIHVASASERAAQALPDATYVRAVVTRVGETTCYDPDTEEEYPCTQTLFRNIADGPINTDITMQVPAGSDYKIDVLTYARDVDGNGLNVVRQYTTVSNVTINQGVDNTVNMPTLADCLPSGTFNVPNPIESGLTYDLRPANYPQPVRPGTGFVSTTATDWFSYSTTNTHIEKFVAPAPAPALNITAQFFIAQDLLNATEFNKFACYQTASTVVTPPTNVIINIQ